MREQIRRPMGRSVSDVLVAATLSLLTVVGTLAMGMTSLRILPCCGDFLALVGLTSVTTVCVARLFSGTTGWVFFWATVMPSVSCGVAAGLYVLYVPPQPGVIRSLPNDSSTAILDGILMAVLALPVGIICTGGCVLIPKIGSRDSLL